MENIKYDLVVMATRKNLSILKIAMPFYKENLDFKTLFVVSPSCLQEEIEKIKDLVFVDEDSVFPGLSFEKIQNQIERISGEKKRAGWYLQQFLKLAWAYRCDDEYYVVIDSDTIPLNHIDFINNEGKYLFTSKIEYNMPYFETLNTLFSGAIKRVVNFSFIAENMIFDTKYVKEMLKQIESNLKLDGNYFFEKIIYAINPQYLLKSGFSEFETYGNYMAEKHKELMEIRTIRTCREAVYILGSMPTVRQLLWAKKDYDLISIELTEYMPTFVTKLACNKFVMEHINMKAFVYMRTKIRTLYRRIVGKKDFRFENY